MRGGLASRVVAFGRPGRGLDSPFYSKGRSGTQFTPKCLPRQSSSSGNDIHWGPRDEDHDFMIRAPTKRAGEPTWMTPGGTSLKTELPAPTPPPLPMTTPGATNTSVANHASASIPIFLA